MKRANVLSVASGLQSPKGFGGGRKRATALSHERKRSGPLRAQNIANKSCTVITMLDWLMNLISSIISFIMGLFGCGPAKKVRFEDEENGSAAPSPSADAVAAVLAGPAETPAASE